MDDWISVKTPSESGQQVIFRDNEAEYIGWYDDFNRFDEKGTYFWDLTQSPVTDVNDWKPTLKEKKKCYIK